MEFNAVHRDLPPNGKPAGNVSQSEKAGSVDREETTEVISLPIYVDGRADREETAQTQVVEQPRVVLARETKMYRSYTHEAYLNKMLADKLPLQFGFNLTHTIKNHTWCSICQASHKVKSSVTKNRTFGFLTDWAHSETPNLSAAAGQVLKTFWLTYGHSEALPFIHHLNLAPYCARQEELENITRAVISQARYFRSAWKAKFGLPTEGGILGGAGEDQPEKEPAPVDVKIRKPKKKKSHNKRGDRAAPSPPVAVPAQPEPKEPIESNNEAASVISGDKEMKIPQSSPKVEVKKELPEKPTYSAVVVDAIRQEKAKAPARQNKNQQQKDKRPETGRGAKRNNLVETSFNVERAKQAGARDCAKDQQRDIRDRDREEQKIEKEKAELLKKQQQARTALVFDNAAGPGEFQARPSANLVVRNSHGFATKLYLLFRLCGSALPRLLLTIVFLNIARKSSLLGFLPKLAGFTTLFAVLPVFTNILCLFMKRKFIENISPIYFRAKLLPGTLEVSRRDVEGNLIDTRPSEIKIGETEMTQREQRAEIAAPVIAVPHTINSSTLPYAASVVDEDPVFTKKLLHFSYPKWWSDKVDCMRYIARGAGYATSIMLSEVASMSDSLLIKINKSMESLYIPEGKTLLPIGDSASNQCDYTIVDRYGLIDRPAVVALTSIVALGGEAFSSNHRGVLGSYDSKALAVTNDVVELANMKALNERPVIETRHCLNFCSHSYNNACTYGVFSSQISPDTNYAMLYRKISRYTAIAIDRFGNKELVTNAEFLARLRFWSVREKPLAKAAAANF